MFTFNLNGLASGKAFVWLCALFLLTSAACRSNSESGAGNSSGVVVVNAPATGVVRRVLVGEGVRVSEGTPIVEIAVENAVAAPAATSGESAEARAARVLKTSNAEIDAARTEVARHEAEVARLTPLVASGEAPQAQLDGERALYDRAQQRLQQAKDAERNAEGGLLAARQPGQNGGSATSATQPPVAREQIVEARTTSAGTVRVIGVRVGERVTNGQVLATLSAGAQ